MTEPLPPREDSQVNGHLTDADLAILADPRLGDAYSGAPGALPNPDRSSDPGSDTRSGARSDKGFGHSPDPSPENEQDPHPERLTDSQPLTDSQRLTDPEHLAQRRHLQLCDTCRAAYDVTERALLALRDPAVLHEPPAGLWDRIAAEIGLPSEVPGASERSAATDAPDAPDAPQASGEDHRIASVTRLPRREPRPGQTRRSLWVPLAAAAVGALLGGAAVAAALSSTGEGPESGAPVAEFPRSESPSAESPVPGPTVVGDATLEPVAAADFSGRAEMVETGEGALELIVEISAAPDPEDGYFEVWLRDEAGTQLISLGTATGETSTFTVPAGIDLSQYPVVDVSHEHFDGDPTHSGTTLAAGPMQDTTS